jgi:hypothetical protein
MNRTFRRIRSERLAVGGLLAGAASCGPIDEGPLGRHAEHPDLRAPKLLSSAAGTEDAGPPPHGGPFSLLDKAIAEDCTHVPGVPMARPWSQHVPDRGCMNDGECGDGYCDRGRCAAIWTCDERLGQRCEKGDMVSIPGLVNHQCRGICLDGRCRSCVSDDECAKELGKPGLVCNPGRERNGGHTCGVPWD